MCPALLRMRFACGEKCCRCTLSFILGSATAASTFIFPAVSLGLRAQTFATSAFANFRRAALLLCAAKMAISSSSCTSSAAKAIARQHYVMAVLATSQSLRKGVFACSKALPSFSTRQEQHPYLHAHRNDNVFVTPPAPAYESQGAARGHSLLFSRLPRGAEVWVMLAQSTG